MTRLVIALAMFGALVAGTCAAQPAKKKLADVKIADIRGGVKRQMEDWQSQPEMMALKRQFQVNESGIEFTKGIPKTSFDAVPFEWQTEPILTWKVRVAPGVILDPAKRMEHEKYLRSILSNGIGQKDVVANDDYLKLEPAIKAAKIVIDDPPPPRLGKLMVQPTKVVLKVGEQASFSVSAVDQDGKPFPVPSVAWSATGGVVSANGMFTAGTSSGRHAVTVRAEAGEHEAVAEVSIINEPPPPPPPHNPPCESVYRVISSDWGCNPCRTWRVCRRASCRSCECDVIANPAVKCANDLARSSEQSVQIVGGEHSSPAVSSISFSQKITNAAASFGETHYVSKLPVAGVGQARDQAGGAELYSLAYHAFWRKDFGAAVEHCEQGILLDGQDARLWYYKGLAESSLGREKASVESLARAVWLHSGNPSCNKNVSQALERIQGPLRLQLLSAKQSVQTQLLRSAASKGVEDPKVAGSR